MFGHHKAKREKKRLKRSQEEFEEKTKQFEAGAPERERQAAEQQKAQVNEKAAQSAEDRKKSYAEGRQRIQDLYNDPSIQGLDPKVRSAMQYEAQKGIQNSHQQANRQLLGDQAQRGIRGQGGVGYAQQRDLLGMANEAQGGVDRDLIKLNQDLRMKNIAATFSGEQGEAAQSQLDKQMALDELQLADEKKRQRYFEDQVYKQWMRL